jgi:ankyrin repeat protein
MVKMKEIIEFIKTGNNTQLEKSLTGNSSLAEQKTEQGISLLQFAVYCRNAAAVDVLKTFKQKLDIFEATSIGEIITVKNLINKNPELVNSFSADGFTLLGLAAYFGHLPLVKLLLDKGANPNIPANNQLKVTPLHSACAVSNFEIAELLIVWGADVNAKQINAATPLHSAALNGQTQLAKLLMDNGAVVNSRTANGKTPLMMAREKHFKQTAELIIEYGEY